MAPAAFTLAALAHRLRVDQSTLWRWEHGLQQPTQRHLRALAKEFGVSPEELGIAEQPVTLADLTPEQREQARAARAKEREDWARRSRASTPPPSSPDAGRSSSRPRRP